VNPNSAMLAVILLAAVVLPAAAEIDLTTGQEAIHCPTVPLPEGRQDYMRVLWDTTHGVYMSNQPDANYSDLITYLHAAGYSVSWTSQGIHHINLLQYDVLVIAVTTSWNSPYTAPEVAAVENFLANGGGLLVMGENPNCPCEHINPITQAFGTTTGTAIINPPDCCFSSWYPRQIFDGVSQLCFRAAGALSYTAPSIEAACTNFAGETVITIYEPCKMIVTADGNFCDNQHLDTVDNLPFILNVFACLAGDHPIPTQNTTWGEVKANFR